MIGCESASTLAMIGSSIVSGSLPRARDTLSRTSAAAESGSRFSVKRTLMRLVSERLCDVITSTPSMPASESSSSFVTCDSTTSADAPRYVVLTLTTGSSMRGYSRTDSRVYEMRPISRMIERQHRREDGPLDADLGQLHRIACGQGCGAAGGVGAARRLVRAARDRRRRDAGARLPRRSSPACRRAA